MQRFKVGITVGLILLNDKKAIKNMQEGISFEEYDF